MKASKTCPENSHFYHALNLASSQLMLVQNLASIILLFFFGWIFMGVAAALNPQFFVLSLRIFASTMSIFWFLLTAVIVIFLHELCHAMGFYWFTKEKPDVKFHILYAYAAAPDWYIPRNQFVLIRLLPMLVLTGAGLMLMPFVNFITLPRLILALTLNAAGSIGDIIVILWLVSQPAKTFVRDRGILITLHRS